LPVCGGAGNIKAIGDDSFEYDPVSRLVLGTSSKGAYSETASYDPFGNRVEASTHPVGSRSIPVNAATNRLTDAPDGRKIQYDSRGNQKRWGSAFYTYDAFDQMALHQDDNP